MNNGYDPDPAGRYDLPPVAAQLEHSYAVAGEPAWTDYSYQARVIQRDIEPYPGLLARYTDSNNYYMCRINKVSEARVEFSKKAGGTSTIYGEDASLRIPRGAHFVTQVHYHPIATTTTGHHFIRRSRDSHSTRPRQHAGTPQRA